MWRCTNVMCPLDIEFAFNVIQHDYTEVVNSSGPDKTARSLELPDPVSTN